MIYHTIRIYIEYKPKNKQEWGASVALCDIDRVDTDTKPNASGFYHFPETMPPALAFEKLKECMIKTHEKEIVRLQKSLRGLATLQYKE